MDIIESYAYDSISCVITLGLIIAAGLCLYVVLSSLRNRAKMHPAVLIAAAIACAGIAIRAVRYVAYRSLWMDEAILSRNILTRVAGGAFSRLSLGQVSPDGFLLTEKFSVFLFGNNEYVLRFFPYVCGILSVCFFFKLSRKVLGDRAAVFSTALFSFSGQLILYSCEVRHYSSDVMVAILLALFAADYVDRKPEKKDMAILCAAGLAAMFFSFTAVFVLAAVCGVTLFVSLKEKDAKHTLRVVAVTLIFAAGILAILASKRYLFIDDRFYVWRKSYLYLKPFTLGMIKENLWKIYNGSVFMFKNGLGIAGIALLVTGAVAVYIKKRVFFIFSVSLFMVTLAAAGLQVYPFGGRWDLFMLPFICLLAGSGIDAVLSLFKKRIAGLGAIIAGALILLHAMGIAPLFRGVRSFGGMRPAAEFINKNMVDGDEVYVYYAANSEVAYYRPIIGDIRYKSNEPKRGRHYLYVEELRTLKGKNRVWVIFSHVWDKDGVDERELFLSYLDNMGTRELSFVNGEVYVYLYDMKGPFL